MSLIQFALSLLCVMGLSCGQILFKLGAASFVIDLKNGNILNMVTNGYVTGAIILYAAITFLWVFLLDWMPLNLAYPIQALAFIIVPLLSWLIMGEHIQLNTFLGALVIIFGVLICTWQHHNP